MACLKDLPNVKKISLCGSGCGSNGSIKPILCTMPSQGEILAGVQNYTGEILLIQGEKDDVVPRESGFKIIQAAKKAKAKLIVVPGVNHNFSKINGAKNPEAEQIWINSLFEFLNF